MHIWLTIPSLSKRGGGPANVVQNLSEHLALLGASVSVLTLEVEHGQSEVLPRDQRVKVIRLPVGEWRSTSGGRLQKTLQQNPGLNKLNIVHDFGLWLPANHAVVAVCQNLGVPLVCSISGMLAPWALRHKAWKKRLAWWLYQRRDLSRATLLAATSEQEVRDIRRLMPGKNIALVPNGVELPEFGRPESGKRKAESGGESVEIRNEKVEIKNEFPVSAFSVSAFKNVSGQRSEGRLKKVVFLGRIHPVKGLKNLVEAWHRVRPARWRCILAGPDEIGHRKELEALLRVHHLENTFEFTGLMEDSQKWALLKNADVFVLPSFTENFGISVAEALACAVPVITTKGTPWKDLVDYRCGWWTDIGVETLAIALQEATSLSDEQRKEMGQRGRRLVEEKYSWPRITREMLEVYQWLAGNGAIPKVVKTSE